MRKGGTELNNSARQQAVPIRQHYIAPCVVQATSFGQASCVLDAMFPPDPNHASSHPGAPWRRVYPGSKNSNCSGSKPGMSPRLRISCAAWDWSICRRTSGRSRNCRTRAWRRSDWACPAQGHKSRRHACAGVWRTASVTALSPVDYAFAQTNLGRLLATA